MATALLRRLLYSSEYVNALLAAADAMIKCLRSGNKILFFGNGGRAADAQHLAAELSGRFLREHPSLSGWALTPNSSALTAIANDYSFDDVFARQLAGLGNDGDTAFAISTSGKSPNVLKAVQSVRENQLVSIGLAGNREESYATSSITASAFPAIKRLESKAHILTGHILCELIDVEVFGNG